MKIFLGVYFLFVFATAVLAEKKWVEAEGSAVAVNISPEQARKNALSNARAEAIRQATGIEIHSERIYLKTETLEKLSTFFTSLTKSKDRGLILDEKILEDRMEMVHLDGKSFPNYVVRLKAQVGEIRKNESLKVTLELNQEFLTVGEEVVLTLWSNFDCFLTVFNFSQDSVYVVFPNELMLVNKLKAEEKQEFPPKAMRELGLKFKAMLPADRTESTEGFFVVATKTNLPFESKRAKSQNGFFVLSDLEKTLLEISNWLWELGSERAEAVKTFSVN